MKKLLSITYRLGRASTKLPKLSFKPVKEVYRAFKTGRDEAKPTTIIVD